MSNYIEPKGTVTRLPARRPPAPGPRAPNARAAHDAVARARARIEAENAQLRRIEAQLGERGGLATGGGALDRIEATIVHQRDERNEAPTDPPPPASAPRLDRIEAELARDGEVVSGGSQLDRIEATIVLQQDRRDEERNAELRRQMDHGPE